MERGFVKIYRDIKDSPIYTNGDLRSLYLHLMLSANHKVDNIFYYETTRIVQQPGDLIFSQKRYAKENKISLNKTFRLIKILEHEGIIETKGTNKYTLVKIKDYGCENGNRNPVETKKKPNRNPIETIKNVKNVKNKYIDHVLLSTNEYSKLVDKFGEDATIKRIERLNLYIGSTGKKYKSHYFTILNWSNKDNKDTNEESNYKTLN